MSFQFTPEDRQTLLDWLVIGLLGAGAILAVAVVLGLAVFLFRAIGGV